MMLQVNGIRRKASIAILIPDKIDFKTKMVTNDKDGHFMIIEGTLHQDDITFINIYICTQPRCTKIYKVIINGYK